MEEKNDFEKGGDQQKSIQEEIMEKQRAELREIDEAQEKANSSSGEMLEAEKTESSETDQDKKIKNLISLVILLSGLLVGSIFVDIAQLVQGSGYSQKNLNKSDIFEADGKTWVAYDAPAVPLSVITDDTCENCDPSDILVWLRRVMPTISVTKVSADSEEGKKLIAQLGINTLPTFVFDPALENTELYSEAPDLFIPKDGKEIMNTQLLGVPVGKYIAAPAVEPSDATIGAADSEVKVVVFSDFQCPYCKTFYANLRMIIEKYKDKVEFVFKDLPLDIHAQATDASLAAACAQDQGKFWEYADKLYASQSEWGNANDINYFKGYAAGLKLDKTKFNECLDNKTHLDKIDATKRQAEDFSISGTPTVFIGNQAETGAISVDQLEKDIEAQLGE